MSDQPKYSELQPEKYPELQPDKDKWKNTLIVIVLNICVVGGLLFGLGLFGVVEVNPKLTEIGADVFLKYIFIIVAVERSAEVYLSIYRSPGRKRIEKRIERVTKAVFGHRVEDNDGTFKTVYNEKFIDQICSKEKEIIDTLSTNNTIKPSELPKNPNLEDKRGYLEAVLQIYRFKLAEYRSGTARRATRIVFVGGILLASVGLSIFSDILVVPRETVNHPLQLTLYRIADIIVTGGLLGGGSTYFNQFISTIETVLEDARAKRSTT